MTHKETMSEHDKAMGLVEQNVDESWTRDGVYDLLIKNGISPTIASGISWDINLGGGDDDA